MLKTMIRSFAGARTAHVLCVLLLAGLPVLCLAAAAQGDDITGVWQTKTGGYVQIYRSDNAYDGRIVGSVDGKARYDKNNPDPDKKGRRLLGVTVLNDLKAKGNNKYDGGEIYDPNNGKSYSAKAELTDHDTLDVRGYIGVSLLGKTQTWHRVDRNTEHVHSDLLR